MCLWDKNHPPNREEVLKHLRSCSGNREKIRYWNTQRPLNDNWRPNLAGAKLSGADLRNIDLQNSNLSNADLKRVNLGMALLMRADLTGADLEHALILRVRQGFVPIRGGCARCRRRARCDWHPG